MIVVIIASCIDNGVSPNDWCQHNLEEQGWKSRGPDLIFWFVAVWTTAGLETLLLIMDVHDVGVSALGFIHMNIAHGIIMQCYIIVYPYPIYPNINKVIEPYWANRQAM